MAPQCVIVSINTRNFHAKVFTVIWLTPIHTLFTFFIFLSLQVLSPFLFSMLTILLVRFLVAKHKQKLL